MQHGGAGRVRLWARCDCFRSAVGSCHGVAGGAALEKAAALGARGLAGRPCGSHHRPARRAGEHLRFSLPQSLLHGCFNPKEKDHGDTDSEGMGADRVGGLGVSLRSRWVFGLRFAARGACHARSACGARTCGVRVLSGVGQTERHNRETPAGSFNSRRERRPRYRGGPSVPGEDGRRGPAACGR